VNGPYIVETDWDEDKARANAAKHDVTFENARTVFYDPLAITVFDSVHSEDEDRWITIGRTTDGSVVYVVHTVVETGPNWIEVRIISARKPTKAELHDYEE